MATTPVLLLLTLSSDNSQPQPSLFHITTLSSFALFLFLTFFILVFTLCTLSNNINNNNNRSNGGENEESPIKIQSFPLSEDGNTAQQPKQETENEPGPENLARSVPPEIFPSSSPKCHTLFRKCEEFDDGPGEKSVSGQEEKKRKKKRARKKRHGPNEDERNKKEELVWLYPFTNSSSATQRKIKQQYDQLVRSHGSNGLPPDQVGQFVNCLVEATNELQNKCSKSVLVWRRKGNVAASWRVQMPTRTIYRSKSCWHRRRRMHFGRETGSLNRARVETRLFRLRVSLLLIFASNIQIVHCC